MLNIDLLQNFNFPYLSRNIAEFWRRWHISLSTWFRDYVYIPLGGSKLSLILSIRNVFIIFLVSGFWHGANWTFLIWGGIHALLFIPSFILGSNRNHRENLVHANKLSPSFMDLFKIAVTFMLVTIAWIFFRSESVAQAFNFIGNIIQNTNGKSLEIENSKIIGYLITYFTFFIISAFWLYRKNNLIQVSRPIQFAVSFFLLILISLFGEFSKQSFIYFQF
jgi:D-alanyl-lipoteichoic acid acyltransferase DltB (MBOAT superfamily)